MKFLEGLAKIQAEDAKLGERVVPVSRLKVEADALYLGSERLQFNDTGFEQLCARFRHDTPVPAHYLNSMPMPIRATLLRHHLKTGVNGGDTIALYGRGDETIGVGRPDLVRLSATDVCEAVLDGLGGRTDDLEITRLSWGEDSVRFDVATRRGEREAKPGDVVFAGVSVSHSLIGEFATRVEGHLYRLVCQNGAVSRECVQPRHGRRTRRPSAEHPNARHQLREQVRRLANDVFEKLNQRLNGLRRLTTEEADLEQLAPQWLHRSRLSADRLMPLLRQAHAEEGGEPTAYTIMNAFSRVATHQTDLPTNTRNILARMGGLLAFGHSRLCKQCWNLIVEHN